MDSTIGPYNNNNEVCEYVLELAQKQQTGATGSFTKHVPPVSVDLEHRRFPVQQAATVFPWRRPNPFRPAMAAWAPGMLKPGRLVQESKQPPACGRCTS